MMGESIYFVHNLWDGTVMRLDPNQSIQFQIVNFISEQEQTHGRHRRTSPQVRSPAPQARAVSHAPGATCASFNPRTGALTISPSPRTQLAPRDRSRLERGEPKVGEIIAHRAWFLDAPTCQQLYSVGMYPIQWLPGVVMEDKAYGDMVGVAEWNGQGIWSFKEPTGPVDEYLLASGSGYTYAPTTSQEHGLALVLGTCYIWGTVLEYTKGYRSQFGAVRSLDRAYLFSGLHWRRTELFPLDSVRSRYGVENGD